MKKAKFVVGVVVFAAAVIWLAATGFEGAKAYYKTVDELYAMGDDAYRYRLKVAGEVVPGSIRKTDANVSFAIAQKDKTLRVSYVGRNPIPDTFVDRAQVVVEGRYLREGSFEADALQAKCASKYEAQNKTTGPQPPAGT